jgi:hypothetical protein
MVNSDYPHAVTGLAQPIKESARLRAGRISPCEAGLLTRRRRCFLEYRK